jgi:hypothetical protein
MSRSRAGTSRFRPLAAAPSNDLRQLAVSARCDTGRPLDSRLDAYYQCPSTRELSGVPWEKQLTGRRDINTIA